MKKPTSLKLAVTSLAFLALTVVSHAQTNVSPLVRAYAPTNNVFSSATPAPNDLVTFSNAVDAAFPNNRGGVFNIPTSPALATGTTVLRGTNLQAGITRQLQITSNRGMQAANNSGNTFVACSGTAIATTTADVADYTLTFGAVSNLTSGSQIIGESVIQLGLVVISRTSAQYPVDVRATAFFSDGTTNAATSAIGNIRGTNVFFGFTAPTNVAILSVKLESFSPGTTTPAATRIGVDDIGLITGITGVLPPPQILSLSPIKYSISPATNGIQFIVSSVTNIDTADISLVLNSNDVSGSLTFTGNATNRSVSYTNLAPDTEYTMVIAVTNAVGSAGVTQVFYTVTSAFTLYDSHGFTDDTLYPIGALQAVTDGRAIWTPNAAEPATIVDVGDPQGKVLERQNTGATRADVVEFPPVSSGTMTIEFDVYTSINVARTLDVALLPLNGGANTMASFLAWGEVSGKIAYYDNVNWLPVTDWGSDWHHCKIINYLSGPSAGKYDVLIDGNAVAQRLPWRNAAVGSAFYRLRIQSANTGPLFEVSRLDNLVITAGLEDPNAVPPPLLAAVYPANGNVSVASNGIHFEAHSYANLSSNNISLIVNSNDVSSQLTLTGPPTNLLVTYTGLLPNQKYKMTITVTNSAGAVSQSGTFYTPVTPVTIFDAGGFDDNTLYPVGLLNNVTNDDSHWAPTPAPNSAQIVDLSDGIHNKVLQRAQLGTDYTDYLIFPPVSSGTVIIEFDANVSSTDGRILDVSLNAVTANGGGTQGPFIMWGTNALNQYNGTAWIPQTGIDTNWHHIKMTCYVSGPRAAKFDLSVDNATVGQNLAWRAAVAAVGTLRIGAIRGDGSGPFGNVDNLVVKVAVEAGPAAQPVTLLSPSRGGSTFSFAFLSQSGVNHTAQYLAGIGSTTWSNLVTIAGDGTIKTITHTNPPAGPLYYRIGSMLQ